MKMLFFVSIQALKQIFCTHLSRCPMQCKSGRTYSDKKFLKWTIEIQNHFFQENCLLNKIKNQLNRRNILTGKNALKVLTTFCKGVSEIINTIVIKERKKYEDEETQHQEKADILLPPHF